MTYNYSFKSIDENTKRAVFNKGKIVPPIDGKHWNSDEWRYDQYGEPIKYSHHGKTNKDTGWEIDHIKPRAKNGLSTLENLQPLQWKNNRKKGDIYPYPSPPLHNRLEPFKRTQNILPTDPKNQTGLPPIKRTQNILPTDPKNQTGLPQPLKRK